MNLGLHYAVYSKVGPPAFLHDGNLSLEAIFLNESDAKEYIANKDKGWRHSVRYEIWLTKEGMDIALQMIQASATCAEVYGAILEKYKQKVVHAPLSRYQLPN